VRLLLVIPAFNEQASLGGLLTEIKALPASEGVSIDAVVVDDGSSDRTQEVARENGARVLRLCRNLGIGGAVQAGIQLAHREGFDAAVQMDGDGQHPPGELAKLVSGLQASEPPDLVVGTRYREGKDNFRSTAMRRLGSWWLKLILRMTGGLRISDPTSGFRLYGPRALKLFNRTYPYDFPEPESLAMARAAGLTVTEVPVIMRERQGGQSSISGYTSVYYMLKVTLAVMLAYFRTPKRPRPEAPDATA
jgi:glycosyltransferase involved in cell wall biosynthesis